MQWLIAAIWMQLVPESPCCSGHLVLSVGMLEGGMKSLRDVLIRSLKASVLEGTNTGVTEFS
jgi:hypothetical protein